MRGRVGICCVKCSAFLTEELLPGVFACRKCNLAYPMNEDCLPPTARSTRRNYGTARQHSCSIYVPLDEVLRDMQGKE